MDRYLAGHELYGDNFDAAGLAEWLADEREAYAALGARERGSYSYGYRSLNTLHGFRHLPPARFDRVLSLGGAYGQELLPLISRIGSITIVEPSSALVSETVRGVPVKYLQPAPSGSLPLGDNCFDLVTCFGVLHHIPNVSYVTGELSRVLKPGGYLLLREPIVSLGDWRKPRRGLTKRERGIPLRLLERIVQASGLHTHRRSLCVFPLIARLFGACGAAAYNNDFATRIDAWLSAAFAWNINYHPRHPWQRLRPTSVFLVLVKPERP